MPMPRLRPVHPRPVSQVPLLLVPQHACPEAPQVPQVVAPTAETTQASGVMQAVTPASAPPPTGQQG